MITLDQITAWATSGESDVLEFKKSTAEKDRACRTLCAFANGRGGRVLFGVTPAGRIVGQTVSDHTLEELAQDGVLDIREGLIRVRQDHRFVIRAVAAVFDDYLDQPTRAHSKVA